MAIREKITYKERCLYELIRHPILFGEFYRNLDIPKTKDPFEYAHYQKEYLADFNHFVSLCCGRAVGKTLSLTDYILWILINNLFPTEYIVYTVPNKVHLEPVFVSLVKSLRNNEFLKNFIESGKGINSSNFSITLLNSAQLICRIAGQSGTGANVIGLHTPIVLLDEGGYYPWGTWVELQPVLNTWQAGHKLFVSGVPSGLRENNVLYFADEVSDQFTQHRTPSHDNPRYTEDDEIRNRQQYGGPESEDYIHLVLGRHGSPTFAVFDRRLMEIETYPVYKISFSGIDLRTITEMSNRIALIPPVPTNDFVFMGVDLGYTEPTSIIILYEKRGIIREHARINMYKVQYPIQEKLIDFLDTRFSPVAIGIDAGNERGLVQHLLEDDVYLHKDYSKRLMSVMFGSWLSLGENVDGEEVKVKMKPYSVTLLQEYTNSHKIVYTSTDLDLITEMERMTYIKTPTGEVVYRTLTPRGGKRGDDHNTSAMLCAVVAYNIIIAEQIFVKKQKPLAKSRWVYSYGGR